jgi:signal transduction histidine kinase
MESTARDVVEQYKKALQEFIFNEGEEALHDAYEIGRQALASNVGLLGLIDAHGDAFTRLLRQNVSDTDDLVRQIDAACRFLSESLSAFDMCQLRNQEANAALRRMNEMLEEEAKRVAHALHDQAGTLLAEVYLDLAEIARDLPQPAVERIQRITGHLDQVREHLRRLSHEVHPPILEQLGLVPAVQFLAEGIGKRTGLSVTVSGSTPRGIAPTVSTTVYRVVQEALNNVTRHAQATRANIRMWKEGGKLHCLIRDNGVGFDATAVRTRRAQCGLGLIGMKERIRTLGGDLQVTSAPGQGTTIHVSLPRQRSS